MVRVSMGVSWYWHAHKLHILKDKFLPRAGSSRLAPDNLVIMNNVLAMKNKHTIINLICCSLYDKEILHVTRHTYLLVDLAIYMINI